MKNLKTFFLTILIFSLIVAWSPSKVLPYLLPIASIFLLLLSFIRAIYIRLFFYALFFIVWVIFTYIISDSFVWQNVLLSLITYSSFIVVFIIPSKFLSGLGLYQIISKLVLFVVLFEACIGFIQIGYQFSQTGSFDLNAGDVVEGTIDLNLANAVGFETPSFAANMIFSIIFLIPLANKEKKNVVPILFFCLFVTFLSAVMHLLIFLLLSFFTTLLLYFFSKKIPPKMYFFTLILISISILGYYLMPTNVTVLLPRHVEKMKSNPKIIMIVRTIQSTKDYPQLLISGLGPGQGVSRASLIASGNYLRSSQINYFIKNQYTPFLENHFVDLWDEYGQKGSTLRPISSWLAMITEAGLLGLILTFSFALKIWLIPINDSKINNLNSLMLFSFRLGVIFLLLMGFQEFYWEYPQAIFLGIILLKVLHVELLDKSTSLSA